MNVVSKVFMTFVALVALYFLLLHPEQVVALLQFFIDSAHRAAEALGRINLHTGKG